MFTKKNNWMIEIYPQKRMDTEILAEEGITPTLVNFEGMYLVSPQSPGLFSRNR